MLPLLRTKTTIPPTRPKQVLRPRLLERMAEGAQRGLTLILAPAGFGKSTLAANWAQSSPLPVAWLSLQPADRLHDRFLAYMIQALQSIHPQLGQTTLALLHSGSSEGALFALINDLSEVESDFALVLDDYHTIDNPEITKTVQFILDHRPAAFHLVIATRTVPALNLARLRAQDQVTDITTADLRFSDSEMRSFLETSMGLELPPEQLTRLSQSTEGWAVGLQLAALALARSPGEWPANRPLLAAREQIFDYLAEEVLHRAPPDVQGFLVKTSLFDRFCIPLCEALLEDATGRAASLLAEIERANLFLIPLDAAGTWYRYHALFSDFLQRQLSPAEAAILYRRASEWFEANSLLDDAIHYAVHAGDYHRAADLLENHYLDMLQRGEHGALLEWIASMPAELIEEHPRLWLARGWAHIIALNIDQALSCTQRAEAIIAQIPDNDRLLGEAKSLRILSGIFGGQVAAIDEISATFVLLAEQDDFLHSLLHFNLGLHHVVSGETALALDAFNETLRLSQSLNNPLVSIVTLVQVGETRQVRGALGLSERAFQQAIRYAQHTLGEHTFLLGMPFISYAELLREQNRQEDARRYAEQGIAYCQIWQPVASMDGRIALARLLAAQGQWQAAYTQLEQAMQVAETSVSFLDDTLVATHLARLALLQGDPLRAAQVIQAYELEKVTGEETYYVLNELAQLLLCRLQIAEPMRPSGDVEVLDHLAHIVAGAQSRQRVTPVIEAQLLIAYALHAAGRHAEAAESLSQALTLGAQGGYRRIFADEGQPLLHLLEQYRAQIHAPRSYYDEILSLMHKEAARPVPPLSSEAVPPTALTPLTRRELDILQLMAVGKSNQEIAAERVLALNTVKKHVANILSKLGVANRTQAVLIARQQGWLEPK